MGICFRIWPLGNGSHIWRKRKWCDRAFSPSAFKNSNSKTAASIYGNVQTLMHQVMVQFPPIQNHSNDWWSTLFSLHAIWPLIAMDVVQAVKHFDMTAHLSHKTMKQKLVKWGIISKTYPTGINRQETQKGTKCSGAEFFLLQEISSSCQNALANIDALWCCGNSCSYLIMFISYVHKMLYETYDWFSHLLML